LRNYEIITIFQDTPEIAATKKAFEEMLTRNAVKVSSQEEWGVRKLPHEIRKKPTGFYYYVACQMDPQKVKDVNHDAHLMQEILHIMVKSLN